jgi:uncharacterized protein (DUF2252 family)
MAGVDVRDPVAEFLAQNRPFARRHPELFRAKIERMAASPFAFFRGTFHLFARDIVNKDAPPLMPHPADSAELDLVGDVHCENFGTFKAADDLTHYDVNDFDEATRGRFDFDVARQATALFLASRDRGDPVPAAVAVVLAGLAAYAEALPKFLKKGREYDIHENAPSGVEAVDHLVKDAAAVKRPAFIDKVTHVGEEGRRIRRTGQYFNLADAERDQALRLLKDYAARMPLAPAPDFYHPEDVCGRISGVGSMGRLRYVVLTAGKGTKEGRNVLVEFKESLPSAYDIARGRETDANALIRRAETVATRQRQAQAASSSFLGFAIDGPQSFQARELGPHDVRVDLAGLKQPALLEGVAQVQCRVLARCHARAAARAPGLGEPLAEVADADRFTQRLLAFALAYADQVKQDWVRFVGQKGDLASRI